MAIKQQITFKAPEILVRKIQDLVDSKEYSSQSGVCEAALTEFFLAREMRSSIGPAVRCYLESDEGKELLKEMFVKTAIPAYLDKS